MSEIACPKCKSTQLFADKKGFSGKKAAAGALLTGGIGLLAGTLGSNKIVITCLACGHKFSPGTQNTPIPDSYDTTDELADRISEIITSHGLLVAIKEVNAINGKGLEEAKVYVDTLVEKRGLQPSKGNSGCAGVFIAIFLFASWILLYL